jgi:hypothetical protein
MKDESRTRKGKEKKDGNRKEQWKGHGRVEEQVHSRERRGKREQ